MTEVYFYDSEAEEETIIAWIQYPGYPRFEKGDIIHLQVNNNNPQKWDVTPLPHTTFVIERVEHSALKYHGNEINFQVRQYIYIKPEN